jgi:uncharacterized protein YjbI with pentapeptide repeats
MEGNAEESRRLSNGRFRRLCRNTIWVCFLGARWGVPSNAPILGVPLLLQRSDLGVGTGPLTWVPRLMALIGYSPFANLTSSEISQKKSTWNKNDRNPDSVAGAQLEGTSLRYARADGAFLADANLAGAPSKLAWAGLFA